MLKRTFLFLAVAATVACSEPRRGGGGSNNNGPPHDSGVLDGADGGLPDAISFDGAQPDSTWPDATNVDLGVLDSGFPDGGFPDSGFPDSGTVDSGGWPDAMPPYDSGVSGDAGCNPMPTTTCETCATSACLNQYCACYADSACMGAYTCLLGCSATFTCSMGCWASYPGSATAGVPIAACTASACQSQCNTVIDPCSSCLFTNCEVPFTTCLNNPDCIGILSCTMNCQPNDKACTKMCGKKHILGLVDLLAVQQCSTNSCSSICGF